MPTFPGTSSDDTLTGTTGTDTITGDLGADSLSGGLGADIIYGDLPPNTPLPPVQVGPEVLVTPTTPLWQTGSSVAGGGTGGFVVVFAQSPVSPHPTLAAQSDSQIIGRLYDQTGGAVTGEFTINGAQAGDQVSPSVARLSDGNFIVVWADTSGLDGQSSGIFAQRVSASGGLIGTQFQINDHAAGRQFDPHVTALPNGRFVVSYTTENIPGGAAFDTVIRSFDNSGGSPGTETIVNATTTPGYQWDSSVTPVGQNGEFVVTWQGFTSYNNSAGGYAYTGDIYLQRFSAAGSPVTPIPVVVHPPHAEHDGRPVITGLANGHVLVAWQSYDADADAADIFIQQIDSAGNPLPGGPVQVNSYTTNTQQHPVIAALAGGGYVVVWQSFQQDGNNNGIYARVFDANGNGGAEIMVHLTTAGHQMNPAVAATANGGFVVSWDHGWYDLLNPTLMGEIRARMFDATGTPIGGGAVPGADTIDGGDGADLIYGGGGDDFVDAGAGADTVYGDDGDDIVIGMAGTDRIFGGNGDDTLEGGFGNDSLYGGTGADELWGETGHDLLNGGADNDILNGEAGNDTLNGGGGDDSLHGNGGADSLTGHAGADLLQGNGGADTLKGGGGDDILSGGAGQDQLAGNAGDDLLVGNAGADSLLGHGGADALWGEGGADSLDGGAGNDSLYGAAGADTLKGGSGDDKLTGGTGVDLLTGGAGADLFEFTHHGQSGTGALADTIAAFVSGTDTIDLSAIDAKTGAGNDSFTFIGAAAFGGIKGELRYDAGLVQADRNGDGVSDFEIVLQTAPVSLTAADFFL